MHRTGPLTCKKLARSLLKVQNVEGKCSRLIGHLCRQEHCAAMAARVDEGVQFAIAVAGDVKMG